MKEMMLAYVQDQQAGILATNVKAIFTCLLDQVVALPISSMKYPLQSCAAIRPQEQQC